MFHFLEVRLAEMSSMGIGNKPCLDIRPSADQINDRSISVAQLSKSEYNSRIFENYLFISLNIKTNILICLQHPDLGTL